MFGLLSGTQRAAFPIFLFRGPFFSQFFEGPLNIKGISPNSNSRSSLIRMGNVVELKVGLHCSECIKKIFKAIKKLEDIETYNADMELNKVTVTGNVTTEEVIRVLQKIGKTANTWEGDETCC
ncbi:Copper transport protein CCH [Morella rubra]|uniref:Copper transport protein CCH n=2 Tax=Morella rubra TaxID=262757 RepID=A0A6A1VML3_9ROSI|nr:Copper transport protein CCH [Morella rubra]